MRPLPESLRAALRELAEADAAGVLSEARQRARTRAAKLLEDELVDELLRAAGGARHGHPSEAGPSTGSAWWVYCVLWARDAAEVPDQLEGIEPGTTVEIVREGDLAAIVSAVPAAEYDDSRLREHLEDLGWVEQTARRHEAVLEQTLDRVTIVPLRLCTIYHQMDGVRRLLTEHAAPLLDTLAKVEGCAEWGVKVFADPMATPGEDEPSERESGGGSPGATYLKQRQHEREHAARATELRARCTEAVHERVSACARESISNPPQRPELHGRKLTMLLNGAYLVAAEQAAELKDAIAELKSQWEPDGFVIELTGPWPAYNFVTGAAGVMR